MLSLSQIEEDLKAAMKAKDQAVVDVLRGLKTRMQNEQIAKMQVLTEEDIVVLVRSEIKKRKDAAEAFKSGGRPELARKESQEAEVLSKYLPAQMAEGQLKQIIDQVINENQFVSKDFGKAMGALKVKVGSQADGAILAKLLKEKLK